MEAKFIYQDNFYTNGKGEYKTEQNLINNFYELKENGKYYSKYDDSVYYKLSDNSKYKLFGSGKKIRCNYAQLFSDSNSLLLCNNIPQIDEFIYDHLENGEYITYYNSDGEEISEEEYNDIDDGESRYIDIYQWYLINESLANMLINHTDNLIFYSEILDLYVLGVTHFGTGWDCVDEDFIL